MNGSPARASVIVVAFGLTIAADAAARPSRWAMARDPALREIEAVRDDAEHELVLHEVEKRSPLAIDPILRVESHAPRAVEILEHAEAATSSSWRLRHLMATAYQETKRWEEAALTFESIVGDPATPSVFKANALSDLAIMYARLDRQQEEVEVYERAIALEPTPAVRSIMLANQAEGFMVMGDVSRAIAGYRAALELLTTSFESYVLAPTTLWSLGVALDRSGDLDGALASIERARSYDPHDTRLKDDGWFFVPPYDASYYAALGEWLRARKGGDTEQRLGAYERCVLAWKQYLGQAPEAGTYVPVARARLKLAEKEYADYGERVRTPTPIEKPAGVSKPHVARPAPRNPGP